MLNYNEKTMNFPGMGLNVFCKGLECFLKKDCMSSRSFVIVDVAKNSHWKFRNIIYTPSPFIVNVVPTASLSVPCHNCL